jgi:2-phospho-L-lactate guanylyltransferase
VEAETSAEAVLIPVKRLDGAKLRLSGPLDAEARRRLALAMLADVLDAAAAWPLRLLVTSDTEVAAAGREAGWSMVDDPGSGLNAAVAAGTRRAVERGAEALLVLPFDVPLVVPGELRTLFAIDADVVVARSDDGGTTGLLRRPPGVIGPLFGPDSARRHVAAAGAAGLRVTETRLPGLVLDIDDLADLERLAGSPSPGRTVALARELLGHPGRESDASRG